MALIALLASNGRPIAAQQGPTLSIPGHLVGYLNQPVQAPVVFATGGQAVASTAFSIDFDENCLSLNTADDDGDGLLDGVRFHTPPAFRASASFDATDTDGELDILIADMTPPFATLPDQTLLELEFVVICTPAPAEIRQADVGFSSLPRPSFGDPNGRDVPGSSQDGAVDVYGSQVKTPTPTATPTPLATASSTATPMPSPTATPTAPQTATATPAATPTATATHTPNATPEATSTPAGTGVSFELYLPAVHLNSAP